MKIDYVNILNKIMMTVWLVISVIGMLVLIPLIVVLVVVAWLALELAD